MQNRTVAVVLTVVVAAFAGLGQSASRVGYSPYPLTKTPTDVWVLRNWGMDDSQALLALSLSGQVARRPTGGDFVYLQGGHPAYQLWLDELSKRGTVNVHYEFASDLPGLLRKFAPLFKGYVYSRSTTGDGIRNAVSISGISDALVVTPATVALARSVGLRSAYSADAGTPEQLFSFFESKWSSRILCHQSNQLFLSDYSIYSSAFMFYDPALDTDLATRALAHMCIASPVLGWGDDEHSLVWHASRMAKFVHPADYSINLPLLSNMDLEYFSTQNANGCGNCGAKPSCAIRKAAVSNDAEANSTARNAPHHTVTFIMSDGDNIQWLMNDFATSQSMWACPNRGKVPIGWTVSPALAELAPLILDYYHRTMTVNDEFVTAASGVGYIFPDEFPQGGFQDLAMYSRLTSDLMAKSGQRVLSVIGGQFNLDTCNTLLQDSTASALLWYDYVNYAGMAGRVYRSPQGKIITGPRYVMSSSMGILPAQLAARVNTASTDVTSPDAYTIVVVHVWTMDVNDVVSATRMFGSNVVVKSPSDFLTDLAANVRQ
eukprot:TRINITY_DN12765_c0_g1_i1.p1 TRINITY_DN12765_c0_g1~~TRINITY_DN12765_c0_g1_i1.p1  ORF type:complete len:546 (-),score=78.80 TRINITY_DN12765_c0_g1_i1:214-1851(-)